MLKKIKILFLSLQTLVKLKLKKYELDKKSHRPNVINLNANDICNSKCTMCNIWKNKLGKEITYDDLRIIFKDDFYSEVKGVGITGGEPTLREDLVNLYKGCIDFLPSLKNVSIITNCIKAEDVKKQLKAINDLCLERGVGFGIMVSLDGYGKVHDRIRGREGNFDSVLEVIDFVRNELKLPVSFGATISKDNLWEIDELLDFAKENKLYGRFRVAEFIKRLYNDDRSEVIRNFTEAECYHLALFFEKLKRTYEKNKTYQRTYSSIQSILLGGKRTIGCPYHTKAININAKGELAYCAPKSKILGSAISNSSEVVYNENLEEKKRIVKEDCENCIHDYHAEITYNEQIQIYKTKFQNKFFKLYSGNNVLKISPFLKSPSLPQKAYTILIMGWYGTETVGDKAILGGIVESYKNVYGNRLNVVIGSLYPFITKQTIKELGLNATVISTRNFEFLRYSKVCDEVIMGGGPLMDLNELYVPLLSFEIANHYNKIRTVYGCGLGPLYQDKFKKAVKRILELATTIKLRDYNSITYAKNNFGLTNIEMSEDPAKTYIQSISKSLKTHKTKTLSLFLRDWEFAYGKTKWGVEEFENIKSRFENALAQFIKQLAEKYDMEKIEFHHMHNFVIGGDDRDFSRRFIKTHFKEDPRVSYNKKLSTVNSVAQQMINSDINVCMRFHSVVFANTLNTNFYAIDYTLGGKIEAYLTQEHKLDKLNTIEQVMTEYHENPNS